MNNIIMIDGLGKRESEKIIFQGLLKNVIYK